MSILTCSQFVELVLARKGCQFIGMDTETSADIKGGKKSPYYGATKLNRVSGMIGASYVNLKNKELVELGLPSDYVVGPRLWGQRIIGTPFIVHTPKGETVQKLYIEFVIRDGQTLGYSCNDIAVDKNDIGPHLNPPKERTISLCTYSLESIKVIRMGGQEYTLDHADLVLSAAKF